MRQCSISYLVDAASIAGRKEVVLKLIFNVRGNLASYVLLYSVVIMSLTFLESHSCVLLLDPKDKTPPRKRLAMHATDKDFLGRAIGMYSYICRCTLINPNPFRP